MLKRRKPHLLSVKVRFASAAAEPPSALVGTFGRLDARTRRIDQQIGLTAFSGDLTLAHRLGVRALLDMPIPNARRTAGRHQGLAARHGVRGAFHRNNAQRGSRSQHFGLALRGGQEHERHTQPARANQQQVP